MSNILRIVYPICLIIAGVLGFIEIKAVPGEQLAASFCTGSVIGFGLVLLYIEMKHNRRKW